MTFVSYAQHLEDVVLYRALSAVSKGFYIDVGAQDPVVHSVTKAFYDRGWTGVNLEPVEEYFAMLERHRPRDVNLNLAASNVDGLPRLYEIPDTGLSTLEKEIADSHARAGFRVIERVVPSRRLDSVCDALGIDTIHFLKIDVEGAERQVLEGISLDRYRPWIVVVEATRPMSDVETQELWEELLLDRDYSCAHFDGLNRYYIAAEHGELRTAFDKPPTRRDYVLYTRRRHRLLFRVLGHRMRRLLPL